MIKVCDVMDWAEHFDFSISESEAEQIIDYCKKSGKDYYDVVEDYVNDKIKHRSTNWVTD